MVDEEDNVDGQWMMKNKNLQAREDEEGETVFGSKRSYSVTGV